MKDIFRNELKYVVSDAELALVESRIKEFLKIDANAGAEGTYIIRSVYFDDMYNTCYYENEDGVDPREKFRIRIYNGDSSHIRLELKKKRAGKAQKHSCMLTKEQCRSLINGIPLPPSPNYPPILQKLLMKMRMDLMKPVVIVEYERTPYVYKNGNVRITLDRKISSTSDVKSFLDKEILTRPTMITGQQIMEVKFDEYIPDFIYNGLQIDNLQRSAFSKFYICRKYTTGVNLL